MAEADAKQRLAAIFAAAVAGYSRLTRADEQATVAPLDVAGAHPFQQTTDPRAQGTAVLRQRLGQQARHGASALRHDEAALLGGTKRMVGRVAASAIASASRSSFLCALTQRRTFCAGMRRTS